MPSLLFIDHCYHKSTHSTVFIQKLLKEKYEVTNLYLDPDAHGKKQFADCPVNFYDIVVCFQLLPSRRELDNHVAFRHGIFFPMYDAIPPLCSHRWYEYQDFQIINFCKALHEALFSRGFCSHYIQYFPEPHPYVPPGDATSLFFWQRTNAITIHTAEKLFSVEEVQHIHLHGAVDPGFTLMPPSESCPMTVSRSSWFSEKSLLHREMEKCALYLAPRPSEGIGMSFLEAMAMGRCVIAPDQPTMNEYIIHGRTGYLYSLTNPLPLRLENIRKIQESTRHYMQNGYKRWLKEQKKILEWMENPSMPDQKKLKAFFFNYHRVIRLLGIPILTTIHTWQEWKVVIPHFNFPFLTIKKTKMTLQIVLFRLVLFSIKKKVI